jgi:hypothetical protein
VLTWLKTKQWFQANKVFSAKVEPILDIQSLTGDQLMLILSQKVLIDQFDYAREVRIGNR